MKDLTLSPELEESIINYESSDFVVRNEVERDSMVCIIRMNKVNRQRVITFFKPQKDALNKAKEELMKIINPLIGRCDVIEKNAKQAILKHDDEQEEIRRKEQARLQAIADEQARRERERLEKKAAKLKSPERAEALLDEASSIITPVVQVEEQEKAEGVSARKTWKHRVINTDELDRQYMIPNDKMLDGIAKSTKGNIKIKGVEFYAESSLTVKI